MLTNEEKRRVLEKYCTTSTCVRCPINTHIDPLYKLSYAAIERYFDILMRYLFGENPFPGKKIPEDVEKLIEKRFLEVN